MNVTPELISLYVDGAASPEEIAAVEAALEHDEALQGEFQDLQTLNELFGHGAPDEDASDEFMERLYALRPVTALPDFEPIKAAPVRRIAWSGWHNWAIAAAAIVLCAVGIRHLTHRPELPLHNFTRLTLNAQGEVVDTRSVDLVTMRSGDTLETGANEKVSFQTGDGSEVVLMPGSTLDLGDPRESALLEIHTGTVLCTVPDHEQVWSVRAADYVVHTGNAHFGVRVEGQSVRASGAGGTSARVSVAVSRGSVEVGQNGDRETVNEYERVVLRRGEPVERSHVSKDPIYVELMRTFRQLSDEILPGYFTGERGVRVISSRRWANRGDRLVLTVTDGEESAGAKYLVFRVRAAKETPLAVTRLVPYADAKGLARATTVQTASVGTDWTIVAIPLSAFDASDAERSDRKISEARSTLARLELRAAEPDIRIWLRTCLWAERPPSGIGR